MAVSAIAGIAAIGGSYISAVAAGAAFTWATAAAAFAIGSGLSIVSRALMPKPNLSGLNSGTTATIRESAASRKLIYGRCRVGGALVFIANSNSNSYLHLVICFAAHEVDEYEEFWFGDEKVWENGSFIGDWGQWALIREYDGTQTTADITLQGATPYWTQDHILNGISYAYVRLEWDKDRKKFPNGVPNISAVIRGKKVYDPREPSHSIGDSSTWEWSQNPALCMNDYLIDRRYGLAESQAVVNSAALIVSANHCDQQVSLDGGGSQNRYSCDGVIDTTSSMKSNAEAILGSMGGRLSYSGGEYYIQSAQYYSPTITIDESMLVGEIKVQTKQSRRSNYNGVKGVFLSEEENYQLSDYPAQISSSYAIQDGDPIYLDMPLPFVTNNVRAQRLAKIALLKSRQQTSISIPVNLTGLKLKAGDVINVDNARMGWSGKPFEVIDYSLSFSGEGGIFVNLNCIETDPAVYDWNTSDQIDFLIAGELLLNDGTVVAPVTNLTAIESTQLSSDGTVIPAVLLSWDEPLDSFIDYYEIKVIDNSDFTESQYSTNSLFYFITAVISGNDYTFEVVAVNEFGIKSEAVSVTLTPSGDITAPAVPTGLVANGGYKQISLAWVNPLDADFKHVEIQRKNNTGTGYTTIGYSAGGSYVDFISTFGTIKTYRIRSVDFSNNASAYTATVSAETDFVDSDAFTQEVQDLFTQAGLYGIEPVSSLPSSGEFEGQVKYQKSDNKLYRWTGSAWTAAVPAVDITGNLTSSQISDLDAAKITGEITGVQIEENAISAPKISAGAVIAGKIASNAIVADNIQSGAITTAKMLAGTIDADRLVANSITGGLIAASGIITNTAQIENGLITNAKIANLAVDTAKLGNASITTAKIASAQVDTIQIAGNAVLVPEFESFVATPSPFLSPTLFTAASKTISVPAGIGTARFVIMAIMSLDPLGGSAESLVECSIYANGVLNTANKITFRGDSIHANIIGSYLVEQNSSQLVEIKLKVLSGDTSKPLQVTTKLIVMTVKR